MLREGIYSSKPLYRFYTADIPFLLDPIALIYFGQPDQSITPKAQSCSCISGTRPGSNLLHLRCHLIEKGVRIRITRLGNFVLTILVAIGP